MKMMKMLSKIDDDILDEIIGKCEAKMVEPGEGKPFKKKVVEVEMMEPEMEEVVSPKEEEDDGLSEEDLLELLRSMKG